MSEINVLYPFDNNYAPFACVSMTSMLVNNKHADAVHVYVLGFGLSDDTIHRFEKTISDYGRDITIINPAPVIAKINGLNLPSYRGASVAVARLFVTDFIPEDVERLLYLDSDTIVSGELDQLVNIDLSGNTVGMVCDSVGRDYKKYRDFADNEEYYNGGMIVYDMHKWRERKCTERIISHVQNVRGHYEALDQDLINIVLKGEIKRLDLRYNFQPFHRVYSPQIYLNVYGQQGYYNAEEIEKASENTVIFHAFRYLGVFPWHKNSPHPFTAEYENYRKISEWKDMEPIDQPAKGFVLLVECILQSILPRTLFLRFFRFVFAFSMGRIEKQIMKNKAYKNI